MTLRETIFSILNSRFDLEEIKYICFMLGIDFDQIPGDGKNGKARELVLLLERTNELNRLIEVVIKERPDTRNLLNKRETVDKSFSSDQIEKLLNTQSQHLVDEENYRKQLLEVVKALIEAAKPGMNILPDLAGLKAFRPFVDEVKTEEKSSLIDNTKISHLSSIIGNISNFSLSAGTKHLIGFYGISRTQFSTNTLGAVSFCLAISKSAENNWLNNVVATDDLVGIQPDGDIVAVGSPISDPIAKSILEYDGDGYRLSRSSSPLIQLPYEFVMHEDLVDYNSAPARRFVAGEEKTMPNWRITENGKFLPPPKLNNRGWIQTDYMLITRIPNFLTRRAFLGGAELLSIAGTHGVGTYAIKNLLNDQSLLATIKSKLGGAPYFQILVPVTEISHQLVRTEMGDTLLSFARELGEPIVKRIDIDAEKILAKV